MAKVQQYVDLIRDMESNPAKHIERLGSSAEYQRKLGAYQSKVIGMIGSAGYVAARSGNALPFSEPTPEQVALGRARAPVVEQRNPVLDMTPGEDPNSEEVTKARFKEAAQLEDPVDRALALGEFETFPADAPGVKKGDPRWQEGLDSASGDPLIYRPAVTDSGAGLNSRMWFEPSLEQAREALRPRLGEDADALDENSPEVARYRDAKWSIEYDRAQREGTTVSRVAYLEGTLPKAINAVLPGAMAAIAGIGNAGTMGVSGRVTGAISEDFGQLEQNAPGGYMGGKLIGYVMPQGLASQTFGAASKVGRELAKKAGNSVLSRMGYGALAGAASAPAVGAVEDVVETAGTEKFGDRMSALPWSTAYRAILGGGLGAAAEGLGPVLERAETALRSRPSFSPLIEGAEKSGVEMTGFGGVREPPAVLELRKAGGELGPAAEAARRALAAVPERDTMVGDLVASGALPRASDVAAEVSPLLGASAAARQNANEAVIGRSMDRARAEIGDQRQPFQELFDETWNAISDRVLRSGGKPWPWVDVTPVSWLSGVADMTAGWSRPMMEQVAKARGGRVIPASDLLRLAQSDKTGKLGEAAAKSIPEHVANLLKAGGTDLDNVWVAVMPRHGTVAELEAITPRINALAKVRSEGSAEPVDPLYKPLLVSLYRVRNRFSVGMPAELAKRADVKGKTPYVEGRSSSFEDDLVPEGVRGWGAVYKAADKLRGDEEAVRRAAGFPPGDLPSRETAWVASRKAPEEMSPRGAKGLRTKATNELRRREPDLTYEQRVAQRSATAGYTGDRLEDAALRELASGTGAEGALPTLADLNLLGEPASAFRRYGLPGSESSDAALLRQVKEGFGARLPQLSVMNRLGGSKEAILAEMKNPADAHALGRAQLLEELMPTPLLRPYRASVAAENLRNATKEPSLRLGASASAVPKMVSWPKLGAVGNMAYPWVRAAAADSSSFPTPGPMQAQRFGRPIAKARESLSGGGAAARSEEVGKYRKKRKKRGKGGKR